MIVGAKRLLLAVLLGTLVPGVAAAAPRPTVLPAAAAAASFVVAPAPDSVLWGGMPVSRLEFSGHQALSVLELSRVAAPPLARLWTGRQLVAVADRLLAAYRQQGYLEAQVATVAGVPAGSGVVVTFSLIEGPAMPLVALDIHGATVLPTADIRALCGQRLGQPFAMAPFVDGLERLLEIYENSGRPFAAVHPLTVDWRPDGVALVLDIREGPRITVGRLEVRGNQVTRAAVIERLAGIRYDVPFAQTDLDRARQRLLRSSLFRSVAPLRLAQDADRTRGVLIVEVREGNPNRLVGVLGYSGREQGLTGLFDLELGNISGTGRRAQVHWEGRGNGISLFQLDYAEPWIFATPLGIDAHLGHTVQDTLYTLTELELVGDLTLTPDWHAGIGWERESTVQSQGSVLSTTRNALLVRTRYDTRDSRLNPRHGLRAELNLGLARKRLRLRGTTQAAGGPTQHVGVRTAEVMLERAQPWARRHVTLVRVRGQLIVSEEAVIPFYELYPLGGATSLRGYREEQFRGSRVGLLTLEQRVILDAAGSRLFGFTDVGLISTAATEFASAGGPATVVKVGYGVGLRVATRLGLTGVDYGLGENDGPLDGKIHFLLEAAF